MELFRTPFWLSRFPKLRAGQTTRHGGVSLAPYSSLNLGKSTDDDEDNVQENRRRFCYALGFAPDQLAWSFQVHGTEVRLVDTPGGSEGYDALITRSPDVLLVVSVADCAPILVYDARTGAMAAIHAGWKGTTGKLVFKTLETMAQTFGTRGEDCWAMVGACIGPEAFEVGAEVAEKFEDTNKKWDEKRGKFVVDLKKANADQLLKFGVPETHIDVSPWCTATHVNDYFSHRAEKGTTGRMLGFIGVSSSTTTTHMPGQPPTSPKIPA